MKTPPEFVRLTQFFWQGSDKEAASQTEWISQAVRALPLEDRAICKGFVKQLLDGNASDAELNAAWKSGSPSYGIRAGRHRYWFEQIYNAL